MLRTISSLHSPRGILRNPSAVRLSPERADLNILCIPGRPNLQTPSFSSHALRNVRFQHHPQTQSGHLRCIRGFSPSLPAQKAGFRNTGAAASFSSSASQHSQGAADRDPSQQRQTNIRRGALGALLLCVGLQFASSSELFQELLQLHAQEAVAVYGSSGQQETEEGKENRKHPSSSELDQRATEQQQKKDAAKFKQTLQNAWTSTIRGFRNFICVMNLIYIYQSHLYGLRDKDSEAFKDALHKAHTKGGERLASRASSAPPVFPLSHSHDICLVCFLFSFCCFRLIFPERIICGERRIVHQIRTGARSDRSARSRSVHPGRHYFPSIHPSS